MEYIIYNTYEDLINFAKSQVRQKCDGNYYELHHIIPRNEGGLNDESNLVLLTLFEHFQAHLLLAEKYENIDKQKFFANISACSLILTGKTVNIRRVEEAYKILHDKYIFQEVEKAKVLMSKIEPPTKGMCFVMKDGIRKMIKCNQAAAYITNGWTRQTSERKWMQKNNQGPELVSEKSWQDRVSKGFKFIEDCPICHKPNSDDSYACCEEHEKEYLNKLKENVSKVLSEHSAKMGADPEIIAKRTATAKQTYSTRNYDGFAWVHKDGETAIQIKKDEVDKYLLEGYKTGRGEVNYVISDEMRKEKSEKMKLRRHGTIFVYGNDRKVKTIKKEEWPEYEKLGYIRGRPSGEFVHKSGYKQIRTKDTWITDGTNNMQIKHDDSIPEGWHLGRAKMVHTKNAYSEKEYIWVHKDDSMIRICKDDLQAYLDKGYVQGRGKLKPSDKYPRVSHCKGKIWYTDGVNSKMCSKNEIPDGWKKGRVL